MTATAALRCAIYTRKSSEEGLKQSFNSLHAQREACEAYIRSQSGEGWRLRRDRYDDGGFSGGRMDRPALRRLLSDVAERRIDVVVVYKVDRLTRSLTDFAKIVDAFDKSGVAFVSVTQAFNTTTSMGRLTLNVLLSFAQFEREITGERIRDKIAASKVKGMWMGGVPPLGYDPPTDRATRALVVNEGEAETVRLIFQRYLELGNLSALQTWLHKEGVHSKRWTTIERRPAGGQTISRGALRHLLKNRIYLGEIVHKGHSHAGRHPPILRPDVFEAAQALLTHTARARRARVPRAATALFYGRLFDCDGQLMEPLVGRKQKTLYRYYVSKPVWRERGGADDTIRRVPAGAVEELVLRRLASFFSVEEADLDRDVLRSLVARVEIHSAAVHIVLWVRALAAHTGERKPVELLRRRLRPREEVATEPHDSRQLRIQLPVRLKVRGGRTWAQGPDGEAVFAPASPDKTVIRRIRAAHRILRACGAYPDASNAQLRFATAPKGGHQLALARWAFLAPDLQRDILEGSAFAAKAAARRANVPIPLLWSKQRELFSRFPQNQ
jgi:site-specific DNA recombinase